MTIKLEWYPTRGLVGGITIQFAEGRWDECVGDGIALNEAAFDIIEPFLMRFCPEWTPRHRYGAMELSPTCRKLMVDALRQPDYHKHTDLTREEELCFSLADWLAERLGVGQIISVFGI